MIRQAIVDDAEGIAQVHVRSWQGAYVGVVPDDYLQSLSVEARAERWREGLSRSTEGVYVSEENGRIIGFIAFGLSRDEDADGAGEIFAVYVHPDAWGKGNGRQLMQIAETKLWQQEVPRITLWVLEGNESTRRFYEKGDYSFDGTKNQMTIGGKSLMGLRYVKHEP